jgi:[FeFe] hydrogenase H-cluster maturation GTPase HydF
MLKTQKALRLHIAIFGRRNVGKSSLLNALTDQPVSIVSNHPGTTTDPVDKAMELLPLGPVLFIDTAGIDDVGALGELRVERTYNVFNRADMVLLVVEGDTWGEYEERIKNETLRIKTPLIVVINKTDLFSPYQDLLDRLTSENVPYTLTSATEKRGINVLKDKLLKYAPEDWFTPPALVGDLLPSGDLAVFVVPIDLEAPKGRLILPQVEAIRDILDNDAYVMVVKERELMDALGRLNRKPGIVVADSQCILKVIGDTPPDVRVTTFSILFARYKGDLVELVRGAGAIERLRPGDKVLISEACTHHPVGDDIGRIKIPRWLRQYVGGKVICDVKSGKAYPDNIDEYKLIIHCGGCMLNKKEMLSRIQQARHKRVSITNYGVAICFLQGVLHRALEPFPYAQVCLEDTCSTIRSQ